MNYSTPETSNLIQSRNLNSETQSQPPNPKPQTRKQHRNGSIHHAGVPLGGGLATKAVRTRWKAVEGQGVGDAFLDRFGTHATELERRNLRDMMLLLNDAWQNLSMGATSTPVSHVRRSQPRNPKSETRNPVNSTMRVAALPSGCAR